MSGYLAIATVTEALRRRLQVAFLDVGALSAGPQVTTGKPTSEDSGQVPEVGANIYLYQVGPNAAFRNADLATRDAGGTLVRRPQVALDLSYLITFYGREDLLEPQRLLGRALSALHAAPEVTRADVERLVTGPEAPPFLAESPPPLAPEPVRLIPVGLTLEELSKVWTVFFQAAHRLSVAYLASPVLVPADLYPDPSLPARTVAFRVRPDLPPRIGALVPEILPCTPGAVVEVQGTGLSAAGVAVGIGGVPAEVTGRAPGALRVALPEGLAAGAAEVSVGLRPPDDPAAPPAITSSRPLVLRPALVPPARYRDRTPPAGWAGGPRIVTAAVAPDLSAGQEAELLLNPLAGGTGAVLPDRLCVSLDPALAKGLAPGPVPKALAAALADAGYPPTPAARVETVSEGAVWRVADGAEAIALRQVRGAFLAFPGLGAGDDPRATAFAAPELAPGRYLIRVRIGGTQFAESSLIAGAERFDLPAAEAKALDAGKLSPALRKAFDAKATALGPDASVTAEGEGAWRLHDPGTGSAYLLRRGGKQIAVFALDVPGSVYIAPLLDVP